MSPITIVCLPAFVNAAHPVRPSGGVMRAPATVAAMSARGSDTLNTPSFASSAPFAPVSCSIAAVSRPPGTGLSAAALLPPLHAKKTHAAEIARNQWSMRDDLRPNSRRYKAARHHTPVRGITDFDGGMIRRHVERAG